MQSENEHAGLPVLVLGQGSINLQQHENTMSVIHHKLYKEPQYITVHCKDIDEGIGTTSAFPFIGTLPDIFLDYVFFVCFLSHTKVGFQSTAVGHCVQNN